MRQIIRLALISFISIIPNISISAKAMDSTTKNNPARHQTIKIAMAQIICIDGDLSGNLVRITNALDDATQKQADIIVFPESSLLGWINPEAFQRATPIPGRESEIICELARKYKIHICIGLDEKDGDKLYDSAILVDDNGKILIKHRKINVLPDLMTPPYSVGEGVQTVQTRFGTIGVMICADSFSDNLLEIMQKKKPHLLLIPYGWAAPESEWPEHGEELLNVVKKAALKANCPVIGTNLIGQVSHGPWAGQIYGGQSVAFDPGTHQLLIGKDRDKDLLIISIDLSKIVKENIGKIFEIK